MASGSYRGGRCHTGTGRSGDSAVITDSSGFQLKICFGEGNQLLQRTVTQIAFGFSFKLHTNLIIVKRVYHVFFR